ncbi:MAG: hypothetical protein ABIG20_00410 [archaeon]
MNKQIIAIGIALVLLLSISPAFASDTAPAILNYQPGNNSYTNATSDETFTVDYNCDNTIYTKFEFLGVDTGAQQYAIGPNLNTSCPSGSGKSCGTYLSKTGLDALPDRTKIYFDFNVWNNLGQSSGMKLGRHVQFDKYGNESEERAGTSIDKIVPTGYSGAGNAVDWVHSSDTKEPIDIQGVPHDWHEEISVNQENIHVMRDTLSASAGDQYDEVYVAVSGNTISYKLEFDDDISKIDCENNLNGTKLWFTGEEHYFASCNLTTGILLLDGGSIILEDGAYLIQEGVESTWQVLIQQNAGALDYITLTDTEPHVTVSQTNTVLYPGDDIKYPTGDFFGLKYYGVTDRYGSSPEYINLDIMPSTRDLGDGTEAVIRVRTPDGNYLSYADNSTGATSFTNTLFVGAIRGADRFYYENPSIPSEYLTVYDGTRPVLNLTKSISNPQIAEENVVILGYENVTPKDEKLEIYHEDTVNLTDGIYFGTQVGPGYWVDYVAAQSFELEEVANVTSFDVYIQRHNIYTEATDILASIQTDSGGFPSSSEKIAEVTIPALSNFGYEWKNIKFDAPVDLNASTTYWLVLNYTGGSGDRGYMVGYESIGHYSEGRAEFYDEFSGEWNIPNPDLTQADTFFKIYIESNNSTVETGYFWLSELDESEWVNITIEYNATANSNSGDFEDINGDGGGYYVYYEGYGSESDNNFMAGPLTRDYYTQYGTYADSVGSSLVSLQIPIRQSFGELQVIEYPISATPQYITTIDRAAPTVNSHTPAGTTGSSAPTLEVTTNEPAECRYSLSIGTAYKDMTGIFDSTNSTTHTKALSGLGNSAHHYYVRCNDTSGKLTASEYDAGFTVNVQAQEPSSGSGYSSTPAKNTKKEVVVKKVPEETSVTEVINLDTETSSVESSSMPAGGGGSGSSIVNAVKIQIKEGESQRFVLNKEEHSLTVDELGEDYAIVTIRSEPFRVRLNMSEVVFVDLDGDDVYDMALILNSIDEDGNANVTFMKIRQEQFVEGKQTGYVVMGIAGASFGAIALAALGLVYFNRKKSITYVPKEQNREEIIEKMSTKLNGNSKKELIVDSRIEGLIEGLSEREADIIKSIIKGGGESTQKNIYHDTGISNAALSRWIAELEQKGFVETKKYGKLKKIKLAEKFFNGNGSAA